MKEFNNVNEFKAYCKSSVTNESNIIFWELEDGREIAYKQNYETPHLFDPEEFEGAEYGDYGYEKAIDWEESLNLINELAYEESSMEY